MKKGGKRDKQKLVRTRAEVSGSKEASPASTLPGLEPSIGASGSHDQEDHSAGVERREICQRDLHPGVEVVLLSGPSRRQGSDVDGKEPDRSTDPPDPPPVAPSTSRRGEPEGMWKMLI